MKRVSFFFIVVFIALSVNTFGQGSYTGTLIMKGNPCPPPPDECPPGVVLWLETTSQDYVLTINSYWIWSDQIVFEGVEYWVDDVVEITGTVTLWQGMEEYHNLEIEAIKKLEPVIVTVTGKLVLDKNPCPPPPDECPPGVVLWLETTSQDYVLTINSYWIWSDQIIFEGVEYWVDDVVEITGTVTVWQGMEEYHELEIETIKKVDTNIDALLFSDNKIYYDATSQAIVIDETLRSQSLILELYDVQGRVILEKSNVSNTISVAHLPNGMYVYRALENNRVVYSGKILKSN